MYLYNNLSKHLFQPLLKHLMCITDQRQPLDSLHPLQDKLGVTRTICTRHSTWDRDRVEPAQTVTRTLSHKVELRVSDHQDLQKQKQPTREG